MNIFKKYWQRFKNRVCAVLCMIALISVNCVPMASAASLSSAWTVGSYRSDTEAQWTQGNYFTVTTPVSNFISDAYTKKAHVGIGFNTSYVFKSNFKIYFSWYIRSNATISENSLLKNPSGYTVSYLNHLGIVGYINSFDIDSFNPNDSMAHSGGLTFTISGQADEVNSIRALTVRPSWNASYSLTGSGNPAYVIPSFQVITSESSAELDALDSLASEIANQSQILEAMKGDIVGLLQQIYTSTGDIEIAFDLLNGYMEQLLPLINSINNNTSNIYSLLSAQFELLRAAIATESQNIQDAIQKQTDDLKAYFDDVLGGAVGTLPDDSASADDIINESHDDEQQYHSDALNRFNELSASFNGFNGDVGSGIALVGTLFSRVWGALGNYVIVYTFPLLLGLALVIIGRLGRGMVKKSSQDRNPDE